MKTIGKIAVLGMTLSLAFALSACGSNAASSSASASASSASASTSAASASATASSASTSASATSSTASADMYTNAAFGIDYILPTGWAFADAGTLQQSNSIVASAASSDAIDMVAVSDDKETTIIVALVAPSSETSGMTAQTFLDAQNQQMQKSLEGANYAFTTTEAEVTFDGLSRSLPATFTTITVNGTNLVIAQAVAEQDGYFLDILAVGSNEANVQNAFTSFRATKA